MESELSSTVTSSSVSLARLVAGTDVASFGLCSRTERHSILNKSCARFVAGHNAAMIFACVIFFEVSPFHYIYYSILSTTISVRKQCFN